MAYIEGMLERILDPRRATLLLALAGGAVLLTVFALQYLGGAAPCPLCVWQRYPYAALIALGLLGWRWRAGPMLWLAALTLLGSAALAGYHAGVEQGWFALPAGCAAVGGAGSVEELRQLLAEAPPACDQVGFTPFGQSLAVWNGITSLALAGYAAAAAVRLGRRRPAEDRFAAAKP